MTEKSETLTAFVKQMHETKADTDALKGHTVRTLEQEEQIAFDGLKKVLEAAFAANGLLGALRSIEDMATHGVEKFAEVVEASANQTEAKQVFACWVDQVYVPSQL